MNTTMFDTGTANMPNPEKKLMTRGQKRSIFFGCMIAIPVLLFIVFYGIVNLDVILMAFKTYRLDEKNLTWVEDFAFLDNFKIMLSYLNHIEDETMSGRSNWIMVTNSLTLWGFKLCIGLPVSVIFSYYVYKKCFGSGFFRVILFLPNVISGIILGYTYREIVNSPAFKTLFGLQQGLLDNFNTKFGTVMFFHLWLGFAAQVLMFTSAMSGIDESIVEAAQMDGVSAMGELWYITFPMVYSTFITFVVISIAEIFTDQMSLLVFFDKSAVNTEVSTIGYFMYIKTSAGNTYLQKSWSPDDTNAKFTLSQMSAMGVMISVVIIPFSFAVKKIMEKVGPAVE